MANRHCCGGSGRGNRRSNSAYGCLSSLGQRRRWDNYPYFPGPCPDAEGMYDCDRDDRDRDDCEERRRCCPERSAAGLFTAMLPMAVAANGMIPLVNGMGACCEDFNVNCGMITVKRPGAYLATYTVRLPEGAEMDTTLTLNVNDAAQSAAIARVGGPGPACFTAQALFDACERATVTLRTSEAINLAETSPQPLVTLSLVRLDEN